MKRTFFTLMFWTIVARLFSQDMVIDEKMLCDKWIVKKGWFDKATIQLERLDTAKNKDFGTIFEFIFKNPIGVYNVFEHRFDISLYAPEDLGMCGNGMLFVEKGEWALNKSELLIDVKGGRVAVSKFHYNIIYTVTLVGKNNILLTRKKVVKSEEKNYGH